MKLYLLAPLKILSALAILLPMAFLFVGCWIIVIVATAGCDLSDFVGRRFDSFWESRKP